MLTGVSIEGGEGIGAAIEAAIQKSLGGLEGAIVDIVPAGRRGSAENAKIARALARQHRNPFYVDAQTSEALKFTANGVTSAQRSTRMRSLVLMGEVLIKGVERHLDAQQNPDGAAFTRLTDKYAAYKRRKFGFTVPIGLATGDLMKNLRVRVTVQ